MKYSNKKLKKSCTVEAISSIITILKFKARVMKLVDVPDSKSGSERSAGSSPASGTNLKSFKDKLTK